MTKERTDDLSSTGILRESRDPKNHDTLATADRFVTSRLQWQFCRTYLGARRSGFYQCNILLFRNYSQNVEEDSDPGNRAIVGAYAFAEIEAQNHPASASRKRHLRREIR